MREICMSGSMSEVWKRSHGRTNKAPPDERGGNRYVRPKATAPHLDSTKLRRTQCEQMSSGLPLKADIAQYSRHVSKVPRREVRSNRSLQLDRRLLPSPGLLCECPLDRFLFSNQHRQVAPTEQLL